MAGNTNGGCQSLSRVGSCSTEHESQLKLQEFHAEMAAARADGWA